MFVINREKMKVLNECSEVQMNTRLVNYLSKNHPEQLVRFGVDVVPIIAIEASLIEHLVRQSVKIARTYGFMTEDLLTAFTVLRFVSAPNFNCHPAIKLVLTNIRIPVSERLAALWIYTTEDHWEEIEASYSPSEW